MSELQFVHLIVSCHGNCKGSYTTHEASIRQKLTSRFHPTFKLTSLQRRGLDTYQIRLSCQGTR